MVARVPVPKQLPPDPSIFVDREALIDRLNSQAFGRLTVLTGPPGVGKTALAVHWSHKMRPHFKHGQIYLDLGGFGPNRAVTVSEALNDSLRALGVSSDELPQSAQARHGLYRTLTADREILILADNASSSEIPYALQPASERAAVIATSRAELTGPSSTNAVRRVSVNPFRDNDALELLSLVSQRPIDAGVNEARALLAYCSGLPIALRVLAERLASSPYLELSEVAEELHSEGTRIARLSRGTDELADVRVVLASSYNALNETQQQTFRMLGLHAGSEFSVSTAAALAHVPEDDVARVLEDLKNLNLLEQVGRNRFRVLDLIHAYMVELVDLHDNVVSQAAAVRRMLQSYCGAARVALKSTLPHFQPPALDTSVETPKEMSFETSAQGIAWFEEERRNLIAACVTAARFEQLDLAWAIPATAYPLFELRGHWDEWVAIAEVGLDSSRRALDQYGQARNLLGLGDAYWLQGDLERAAQCYQEGAVLAAGAHDGWTVGFCYRQSAMVALGQRRHSEAKASLERAIIAFETVPEPRGIAMCNISLCLVEMSLGNIRRAITYGELALERLEQISDNWTEAWAKVVLAQALLAANNFAEARPLLESSREVFRDYGNKRNYARSLVGLAWASHLSGDPAEAEKSLAEADTILNQLDADAGQEVRAFHREVVLKLQAGPVEGGPGA